MEFWLAKCVSDSGVDDCNDRTKNEVRAIELSVVTLREHPVDAPNWILIWRSGGPCALRTINNAKSDEKSKFESRPGHKVQVSWDGCRRLLQAQSDHPVARLIPDIILDTLKMEWIANPSSTEGVGDCYNWSPR